MTGVRTRPGSAEPGTTCYSRQEIANARTAATSVTVSASERRRLQDRVAEMKPC
ncbi:MAG TPA: hypothetical protein VGP22_18655 [Albitalea sp.]|nr:hypothetical protein [Albitalea sp.]